MPSTSPRTTWRKIEREHHLSMGGILVGVLAVVRKTHRLQDLIIVVLPVCPVQAQSRRYFRVSASKKLESWHDRSYQLVGECGLEPFPRLNKNPGEKKTGHLWPVFITAV